MGKYMRKTKVTTGDVVTVMEVVNQPQTAASANATLGVRTRARTLALQKLNSSSSPPPPPPAPSSSSLCYLQLRSRRLQKPTPLVPEKPPKLRVEREELPCEAEASFGENCLDSDSPIDRSTRESTPCTSIRDSNATTGTPGSTTRKTCSRASSRRFCSDGQSGIPSTSEMEEFFAIAERQQQRLFLEKYNFDVVNELPLPGQYEWVQIIP